MNRPASAVLLFCIILITSCQSVLQVRKQHYRNGLYVHLTRQQKADQRFSTERSRTIVPVRTIDSTETETKQGAKAEAGSVILRKDQQEFISERKNGNSTSHPGIRAVVKKAVAKIISRDDSGNERATKTSRILGIMAIILVPLGLVLIEGTVVGLIPIFAGVVFSFIGMKIGRTAIIESNFNSGANGSADPMRKKRAKNAYLLNLIAFVGFLVYVVLRVGIGSAGNVIVLALMLLGLCLILFLLYRMGVFRDLNN